MVDLYYEEIQEIAETPYNWKKLKNKTLLVSGGTGFIGTYFIDVIKYRNSIYQDNIHVISISRHGGYSDSTVRHLQMDILQSVVCNEKVDYIVHLASNTHPQQYKEDPVGTITTNVIGCNNLLKLAVEQKAKFVLASSVEIYGQGSVEPMNEKYGGYIDCNTYRSGYNEAKRTCEALCQSYRKQYHLEVVIARFSRIFGADKKKDSKAMAQFIDSAVNRENIVLKSNGKQRYSFCYIADAVSALLKLIIDGENGEAYNIAAEDDGFTLGDYAQYLSKLAGTNVEYEIKDDDSTSRAEYALMDITKIKQLGWIPKYSVSDGLLRTLDMKIRKV